MFKMRNHREYLELHCTMTSLGDNPGTTPQKLVKSNINKPIQTENGSWVICKSYKK